MSSRSSSHASFLRKKTDNLLPFSFPHEKSSFRFRSCFAHGLYRRVLLWTIVSLVLVSVILYSTHDVNVYDAAVHRWNGPEETLPVGGNDTPESIKQVEKKKEEKDPDEEAKKRFEEDVKKMPWLKFNQYVSLHLTTLHIETQF